MAGIKETTEALVGMGALAVVARKAYRDSGGDIAKFAAAFGTGIALDPVALGAVKDGFDGAGEILGEVKDLTLVEILELGGTAIAVTKKAFVDVQPPVQP